MTDSILLKESQEVLDGLLESKTNLEVNLENDVFMRLSEHGYIVLQVMHKHNPAIIVYPDKNGHTTLSETLDLSNIHGALVAYNQQMVAAIA